VYVMQTAEPSSDGRGRPIENECGCDVQMLELINHGVKGHFARLDQALNIIDADVQNHEICLAWYNILQARAIVPRAKATTRMHLDFK